MHVGTRLLKNSQLFAKKKEPIFQFPNFPISQFPDFPNSQILNFPNSKFAKFPHLKMDLKNIQIMTKQDYGLSLGGIWLPMDKILGHIRSLNKILKQ